MNKHKTANQVKKMLSKKGIRQRVKEQLERDPTTIVDRDTLRRKGWL